MGSMPGLGRSPRVGNGWQPTPVFLPGKFHRQKSLEGCSPWDHKSWTWLSMCTPHIYRIKKVSMYICFQSLCCVWLFVTPWTATNQASLPFTISRRLLRLMSTELVMPSNHLIFCHPLLLLPSVFPSIRVLSNESALRIRWPNVLGASASSPVFPMNIQGWFPLRLIGLILLSKGLSSLFQHYNLKASILLHSAFFLVQLSPPYMTTGKTVALTRWTFVDKVMSLLFNVLSRFVIAFLPRSKHLLISWPQSLFTVILEPKEIKSVTVPISSPSFCHSFLNVEFKPAFHSPFILIKRLFSSSSLSAISYHSNIWGCYFSQQSWFQLVIHPAWHFAWCTLHRS